MKKISYFIFSITMLFVFTMSVSAKEIIVIDGNSVRFRSKPNVSGSSIIASLDKGVELTLLDKNGGSGNGCSGSWYKGQYGNDVGYVCSQFAKIEEIKEINPDDYKEYSDYLKELGFPDSYINKIILLRAKHPKWEFKIMNVNIDFNKFIKLEYDGYSKGWSLIEDTGSYYDGYKSFDSWSYDYLTNVFSNNFTGGGTNWYAASKETIAYYVDPRNFLDEKHVFMFENLSYNSVYHTKDGIELVLKGTFMESGYADTENEKTYADAFMDASLKYNISPYVLASRVIQEVGAKGSTIVSGTVAGYEGYYNFYNIKAYGNSKSETIANGLKHAVSEGWNTQYKAIVGGAAFLGNDYVGAGQDSLYLQKWDIIGSTIGTHQYMQNIQAPYTESIHTYNGYADAKLIDSSFVFTIPVFVNMPDETKLPNKGNPNNYLSSLSVNGDYLFEKATNETEFDLNFDTSTTSIEIAASKVYSKSVVTGTGSVSLKGDKQTIAINVTAQNGDVRTYNINVTRSSDVAIAISEILRLLNIKNDGSYMYGFKVGTDISTIKKSIIDRESKAEVSSFDKNGKSKTSGIIASGDKIRIKTAKEEKEYIIIIYADVNGDGKITAADYVNIKNHIMDVKKLTDFELECADANRDEKLTAADYVTIKNHIMDIKKIVQ